MKFSVEEFWWEKWRRGGGGGIKREVGISSKKREKKFREKEEKIMIVNCKVTKAGTQRVRQYLLHPMNPHLNAEVVEAQGEFLDVLDVKILPPVQPWRPLAKILHPTDPVR